MVNCRIFYKLLGGHVHCRVFMGFTGSAGKCGDLVFRQTEFDSFMSMCPGVAFIEEAAE